MDGPRRPEPSPPSQIAARTCKRSLLSHKTGNLMPISKRKTEWKASLQNIVREAGPHIDKQIDLCKAVLSTNTIDDYRQSPTFQVTRAKNGPQILNDITNRVETNAENTVIHPTNQNVETNKTTNKDMTEAETTKNVPVAPTKNVDEKDKHRSVVITCPAVTNKEPQVSNEIQQQNEGQKINKVHPKLLNWTLSENVLIDLQCLSCKDVGSITPSGQNKSEPFKGPALKCKLCTRTFQE